MGLRPYKVSEEIHSLLSSFFLAGRLNDPRLQNVTLTEVRVTRDLQLAYVYFRLYEPTKKLIAESSNALYSASGLFRHKLSKNLDVRRVPVLRFFYDETLEKAVRIDMLIDKINTDSSGSMKV